MGVNWRRAVMRVVALIFSLLLALMATEVGLRVFFDRLPAPVLLYAHRTLKDGRPAVWERLREYVPYLNLRQEDPDTGWTFKPDMRSHGTNEDGQEYDLTTNSRGFFSPSEPASSVQQLIMLGDSFLSTFYVPQPIAWVIQRQLQTPVVTFAVHGWGPENYRAAYEKFAAGRNHSKVLVFTFMNDVSDVANWAAWKNAESPGMSYLTWIQRSFTDAEGVNTGNSWLDAHSLLWNVGKLVLRRRAASSPMPAPGVAPVERADSARLERFTSSDGGEFTLQFTRGFPFMVSDPDAFVPGGSYYPYMQAYLESLERLKAAIASRGAQMALVWVPSKERVYIPQLPPDRRRAYVTNTSGDINGVEPIMAAYAAQSGIAFFDLTPELSRLAKVGEKLYFTVDGHLNAAGNEVAGRRAADFVRSLPASPPEPAAAGPALMLRRGPLALQQTLAFAGATFRASIAAAGSDGIVVNGEADSQSGYLLQWPERAVDHPMFLVAKGVLRQGGLTVGLLANNQWAQSINVTSTGRFDLAIPVVRPGRYVVVIANALQAGTRRNDFALQELGWAEPQ
jgi:hypothetical protein